MSDSDIKFIGFGAMWFAIGASLTLTLGVSSGYPEWMPSMFAATGTAAAIFLIMFFWEFAVPDWPEPSAMPIEGRPRPANSVRPPPPPAPPQSVGPGSIVKVPPNRPFAARTYYMALGPNDEWRVETIRPHAVDCVLAAGGDRGTRLVHVHLWRV